MPDIVTQHWTRPAVILVATDLSDTERLMKFALQQAQSSGARLILLHVLAASEAMAIDAVGMPYYDPESAVDVATKALENLCEDARRHNITCDALIREGNAAQQVLLCARQFHVDRILLGTRSRGKVSKLLLGSVAEQVLRSANLPVMTVGPEAHLLVDNDTPERVVVLATTLREASRPSVALACQIATSLEARLILLHVLPPVDEMHRKGIPTGMDSAALRELRILAAEGAQEGAAPIEPVVVHGNPAIEILAEATGRQACLIVLGATQRSALVNLTRDRTVYKVLAHAHCPVLTLREPRAEKEDNLISRIASHSY